MYVFGPLIGATIAVMLIGLVRGVPDKEEREVPKGEPCRSTITPCPRNNNSLI